ncbi:golgin subfamily A member 6-like protein 22, partial [Lethenteron reissneri]
MDRQITWAEILDEYEARESACQSTTWGDVMDKVDPFPGQSYKNRSPKRIIGELKDVSGMKHLQEKNLSKERCTMEEERLFEVQRIARAKCRTDEKYFRDYLLKKRLIQVKYFIDEKHHLEMMCPEEKNLEEEEKCLANVKRVEEEKRLEQEQRLASIATITTTGPIAPSFGEEGFQAEKMDKKTEVEQEEEKVEEEVEEEQEEGMEKTENGEKMAVGINMFVWVDEPSNFKQNLLVPNNMDRQITWAEILDEYEARESACQSTTWGDVMDKVDPFPGQSYKNRSPKRIIGELKDVSGMKHLQEKNLSKERCTMEEERLFEVQRIARAKCRTDEKYFRDYLLKKRLIQVKYFIDEKHHLEMMCPEEKNLEEEEKCLANVKRVEEEKRLEQEQRLASIATITTTGPIAPSFGEEGFQAEKMDKKTEVEQEEEKVEEEVEEEQEEGMEKTENGEKM